MNVRVKTWKWPPPTLRQESSASSVQEAPVQKLVKVRTRNRAERGREMSAADTSRTRSRGDPWMALRPETGRLYIFTICISSKCMLWVANFHRLTQAMTAQSERESSRLCLRELLKILACRPAHLASVSGYSVILHSALSLRHRCRCRTMTRSIFAYLHR